MGHHRSAARGRKALAPIVGRAKSKRKTWTFEKLEDRNFFSATPVEAGANNPLLLLETTATLSSSTPEGAAAIALREQQWAAMQASLAAQSPLTIAPYSVILPNDPLFASQWHLLNTGQEVGRGEFQPLYGVAGADINVVPVWNMPREDGTVGYTGKGVVVAVIDSGVQISHPDLKENISDTLRFNAITGSNSPLPNLSDPDSMHGTAVAGLIAAEANNNKGGSGVAPDATIVPILLIAPGVSDEAILQAFQYAIEHGVDITNNSWGPATERQLSYISSDIYDVLRRSVVYGRDGLGMINVFASGNDGGPGVLGGNYDSASYNPILNSRYVIAVTGVDHDGLYANADGSFTSYPEAGANVLVAAPTGSNVAQNVGNDTGQGSGIWTTDLVGDFGANAAPLPNGIDPDNDPLADPNYTSRFNGTSASAPLVSGIIALMLEANPNLTFRDVQEILVRSSRTTAWYESPSAARGDVITTGGAGSGLSAEALALSLASSYDPRDFARTTTAAPSPGGALEIAEDWGDAPIGYPTTLAENGARHFFDDADPDALRLGANIDANPGVHSANADADDLDDIDDEDGVYIPVLRRGQTAQIIVMASGDGFLNAWIDFSHQSDLGWNTPAEHVLIDQPVVAGFNVINVNIPANAELGTSFARFRLTSAEGQALTPTGSAPDGEVEDYQVTIAEPTTSGPTGTGVSNYYTTWQMNQTGPFRDPDPYFHDDPPEGFLSPGRNSTQYLDPLADPSITFNLPDQGPSTFGSSPSTGNDLGRINSHYELMPGLFANGAGYTVSQGYGAYGDQVGYAHGVVDAELAVQMAKQWHTLGQQLAPMTEKTVTTFIAPGLPILGAEKMANNGMLVPGGIGTQSGFIAYWNEYNADPPAPFDPASAPSWPRDTRGLSYRDYVVPPNNQINVEWVEVKLTISDAADLNTLRIMLTSPDGTQSELNHYYADSSFRPYQPQFLANPWFDTPGGLNSLGDGTVVWTFSTNRNWGESTNAAVILNPITGEPVAGPGGDPIFRNWELHIENWGPNDMTLGSIEIVWHGKEIAAPSQVVKFQSGFDTGEYVTLQQGQNAWDQRWLNGDVTSGWEVPMAQRIQGSIGIDQNGDGNFNYDRYVQEVNAFNAFGYNANAPRSEDIIRRPDYTDVNGNGVYDAGTDIANQEDFAANIVVSLYRVDKITGVVGAAPVAYFLTGADGNFYFDVDPTYEYVIRITDPDAREILDDVTQPDGYMKDYQTEWRVTPDWFFAPDHDNVYSTTTANNFIEVFDFVTQTTTLQLYKPGAILWGASDANGDGVLTNGPMPYRYDTGQIDINGDPILSDPIPMAVKNVNFLLKATPTQEQFTVTGSVFADLNNDGVFNGSDAKLPGITVYVDANRNGAYELGETSVTTDSNGNYTLPVPSATPGTFSIGVRLPGQDWQFKSPGSGVQDVFLPSFPQSTNFALTAPTNAFPSNPAPGSLGMVMGVVFNDANADGIRNNGEAGAAGVRVFIDANQNGAYDSGEVVAMTASNGSFVFTNVTPGSDIWIDIDIANEGTDNAPLILTKPTAAQGGHLVAAVGAGGTAIGYTFGVFDRTGSDWGDLPNQTLAADNGPRHKVVPGFQLGATNSGEVNGTASSDSTADAGDDGVILVGGVLKPGVNTLRVTVMGVGGLLTGWMDFNGDLLFDESERLQWSLNGVNLGGEADINPGTYDLQITVPATADIRPIAARFRWGEPGLSFVGASQIGEVEDYFFILNASPGDYNRNGVVDTADYNVWLKQSGTNVTPFSGADGNGDGVVDQADYNIWRANYGNVYPGAGSGSAALVADLGGSQESPAPAAGLSDDLGGLGGSQPAGVAPGVGSSVADGSSVSSSALWAVFASDSSSGFTLASDSVVYSSSAAAGASRYDLLLLDQTWADLDSSTFDSDDSLYSDDTAEVVTSNDLALAAVLNDQDEWWNTL